MAKLHILVDSRETSVSFAHFFFEQSKHQTLGLVEHIRGTVFAQQLKIFVDNCSANDEILVSVHYLPEDQLQEASSLLDSAKNKSLKIHLASYIDFIHMSSWCSVHGVEFLENSFKKRKKSRLANDMAQVKNKDKALYRIWVQYRLMLAIISRVEKLSDVCRNLIKGMPEVGDTIEKELARALRYFDQGEPDMAGGSYSGEQGQQENPIDELRSRINKIAATDFNVLIKGDSGTGKETVAWAIHELSSRRDEPFIALNCAGLPDELLESEMFGYIKGSHNQAFEDTKGILESVDGGTLFLDELPEMSPRIQAKLLRFMESGEYRPLGSTENRYSNTRIIAAGQPSRLHNDRIRTDLKSRVGQLDISLHPLRELERLSPGTIYKISFILLERYTWTTIFNENQIRELTPYDIKQFQDRLSSKIIMDLLINQEWKESNIRELNNFLRKWIVFGDDELKGLTRGISSNGELEFSAPNTVHDSQLESLLKQPKDRNELKQLVAEKPLQNLKKSYIRHLYTIYSSIIEQENISQDMPKKPTQKELAKIMGVTENTISRHLN